MEEEAIPKIIFAYWANAPFLFLSFHFAAINAQA